MLSEYSDRVEPKSINEFVIDLEWCPVFKKKEMIAVGQEIKQRIKAEIGDWIRVNVGIAPNRFLTKTTAGLRKPDGPPTPSFLSK